MTTLSVIIPIHNDSEQFLKNYKPFLEHLSTIKGLTDYEVVIGDNGSTERDRRLVEKACSGEPAIRYFYTPVKGIGSGMKLGLANAHNQMFFIYSVDFPFGFKIIDESLAAYAGKKGDTLVLGSKRHASSKTNIPLKRRVLSFFYNGLISIVYGLGVKDTQGTMLLSKGMYADIGPHLSADSAFMQAQLCIYAAAHGYFLEEIPVEYMVYRPGSKINPLKDSIRMFKDVLGEYKKYMEVKKSLRTRAKH
ncbi:MAG: glycosyltransferase [Candidatus Altiarchaeia archaeon]